MWYPPPFIYLYIPFPFRAYTHLQARRSLGPCRASKTLEKSVKAEHRVQCCLSGFQDSHEESGAYQQWQMAVPLPLLPSLSSVSPSLTGAPGGPGSPWLPCWEESDERSQPHPGKVGNVFPWCLAQEQSEGFNVLTTGPGVPLGPCRPCIRKGLMNLGPGLPLACSHLLRTFVW